jgi:hypothetical protein
VMAETADQARVRYIAAAHAMQSGVAMKMNYDPADVNPKHLRVGVNSAMVDGSALVGLLIAKGVITEAEYFTALADAMERERDMYAKEIRDHLGPDGPTITLA